MIVIDARRLSEGLIYELSVVEQSCRLIAKTYVEVDEMTQFFVAAEFRALAMKMIRELNIEDAVATSLACQLS